jgi:hypothetical protein
VELECVVVLSSFEIDMDAEAWTMSKSTSRQSSADFNIKLVLFYGLPNHFASVQTAVYASTLSVFTIPFSSSVSNTACAEDAG